MEGSLDYIMYLESNDPQKVKNLWRKYDLLMDRIAKLKDSDKNICSKRISNLEQDISKFNDVIDDCKADYLCTKNNLVTFSFYRDNLSEGMTDVKRKAAALEKARISSSQKKGPKTSNNGAGPSRTTGGSTRKKVAHPEVRKRPKK